MKKSIFAIALVASMISMLSSCVVAGPGYGYHHHHYHGPYGPGPGRGW